MSEATVTFGAKDKNLKSTITGINREMGGMGKTTKAIYGEGWRGAGSGCWSD